MTTELLVKKLGIPGVYVGKRYLVAAIDIAVRDGDALLNVTKGIYAAVAERHRTTQEAVERALRTVTQHCWERGDREFLREIAGYRVLEKPRVGELIDWAASYLRDRA